MVLHSYLSSNLEKAAGLSGRANARGENSFLALNCENGGYQVKLPKRETKMQGRKLQVKE